MLFLTAFSYQSSLSDWIYYACWMLIRVFVLVIYPIISLAHANAYVYALREQFLVAAPDDFSVIGGRDIWLDYLERVPAIWTVYGLWVTWDRLTGLLWTCVASVGAIIVGFISSQA